jgi:hypothetical protein
MSTKVKEALFELIKSLSKSEKRYFKLLSSRHTIGDENNYVKLFDFIDKQSAYDEEAIFKEFKNEAFLHRFSITKKRLYDHVLSALDAFHSTSSVDAQLFKMMHSADILFNKSLYDQCARILRSAEKLAEKNNRFTLLAEISRKNKRLVENNAYSNYSHSDFEAIEKSDAAILETITCYNVLWKVKSDLFVHLSRKGKARNQEECEAFDSIIKQLPQNLIVSEGVFDNYYLYHHIYSAYYFSIGNFLKCFSHIKLNLENFEKNELAVEQNLNTYFSLLTNGIYVSEKLGLINESKRLLIALKAIPSKFASVMNEDMEIKLFASTCSIELSLLTNNGDLKKAELLYPIIENGLLKFGDKISSVRRAFIVFKMASIQLGLGNFSAALKMVNRILNDSDLDESEDILSFTHLLDLLIHLDMKHEQLLPYALKNTQRFLKSRNRLYSFEKAFLQFVSKRIKCTNELDAEVLWEELHSELSAIKDETFEGVALEYFDFRTWAESKFKKQAFVELIKRKELNRLKHAN